MLPEWVIEYLKIPFKEKGRDRTGLDCYGLVRLVFQEQRQIELPSYTDAYETTTDAKSIRELQLREMRILEAAHDELEARWRPIPLTEVRLFDGLIIRIKGDPIHFGLVLDDQYFLHTMRGTWTVAERWNGLAWKSRVIGAVRYGV